jgi:hypothetical protein
MSGNIQTLQSLAYKKIGTVARCVEVDKRYYMLEVDGVNRIDLGKCLSKKFDPGHFGNDFTHSIKFTFEYENDNPLLKKEIYGYGVFSEYINIFEYETSESG